MPALHRYLAHDEQIVLEVRRHLSVLLRPAAGAAIAIVAAGVVGLVLTPAATTGFVDDACGLVAAFFCLRLAWRVWEWWADRIVVTDERIFEVSGVVTRKVASMPVSRVTDMTYKRSLLGRVFGFGEIMVESAGEQGINVIDHIPQPDHFYRTITSLVTAGLPKLIEDDVAEAPDQDDTGPLPRVSL